MILILGGHGMLGREVARYLHMMNIPLIITNKEIIDLHNFKFDIGKFSRLPIDMIINCGAYTDVVKAEVEKGPAVQLNAYVLEDICKYCDDNEIKFLHFSTDYVYSGLKIEPYTEDDDCNPVNYYGKTKLMGESIVRSNCMDYKILRLQWLYGVGGQNFIDKIFRKACNNQPLSIVTDQFGSPCSTTFVAQIIYKMILSWDKIESGVYHLTHDDHCSWSQYASYFLKKIKVEREIYPILSFEIENDLKVRRPKNTILSNEKIKDALNIKTLGSWKDDLEKYIEQQTYKFSFGGIK